MHDRGGRLLQRVKAQVHQQGPGLAGRHDGVGRVRGGQHPQPVAVSIRTAGIDQPGLEREVMTVLGCLASTTCTVVSVAGNREALVNIRS